MVRVLYKNGSKGSWEVIRFMPEAAFRRRSIVVGIADNLAYGVFHAVCYFAL